MPRRCTCAQKRRPQCDGGQPADEPFEFVPRARESDVIRSARRHVNGDFVVRRTDGIADECAGDRGEWQHFANAAPLDRFVRHPEPAATRLVRGDRVRSGAAHLRQSCRAVGSHAGEDYAGSGRIGGRCDGAEQHVDARAMSRDERAVDHIDEPGSASEHDEMLVARRQDRGAGSNSSPGFSLTLIAQTRRAAWRKNG